MRKILMIIIALGISVNSAYSQNKTIRGLVIDDLNLKEDSVKNAYLKIVHIDSLKNGCFKLVNDVFVIYASDDNGQIFKILSHYNRKIHNEDEKIDQDKFYNLKLYSYFLRGIRKLGVGVQCGIQITGCSYYNNSISIEPEYNIKNLYTTTSLNGIYLIGP